jgi:GNAT superfamily N-acetyltransferase
MKRPELPMSMAEFHTMQHPFGWKAEYWDGKAVFTPREIHVKTKLNLTEARSLHPTYNLNFANPTFKPQMIESFYEAFQDSVEFCNWPLDRIRQHAENNINHYFDGVRGEPLPVSVMALTPDHHQIAGLVLFTNQHEQINLDLLFVIPAYQRKRMATQMVSWAVNQLYENGIAEVYSAYHICNENSQKWHRSFGFQDIYDQFYIRLKYAWYCHEIWRHEELGLKEQIKPLMHERDDWYSQLEEQWKY